MSKTKSRKKSPLVRLNKFIADCGVTSRRKADELIDEGVVKINGKVTYELGIKVDPRQDKVTVRGKKIDLTRDDKVYILFNKPTQVLTSMEDPQGRPTVADFFKKIKSKRIFPVGRLDWDTEGMLLMTNDGEFAQEISHPSSEVSKTYLAKLDGKPSFEQLQKLKRGVTIAGGGKVKAKHVILLNKGGGKYFWAKIVINEGKNRQIRKMFEKIGYDVKKLRRINIGRLGMAGLKKGDFVYLSPSQIMKIFRVD